MLLTWRREPLSKLGGSKPLSGRWGVTGKSRSYSLVFVLKHELKEGYLKKTQSPLVGVEMLKGRHLVRLKNGNY